MGAETLSPDGDLAKSIVDAKPMPYMVSQSGAFFSVTVPFRNVEYINHPKTTIAAGKEVFYCAFEHDNTHFLCTDADEPVLIRGEVDNGMIYTLYIESGSKEPHYKNNFGVNRSVMRREASLNLVK